MRLQTELLKWECHAKYSKDKASLCSEQDLYDRFRQKQAELTSHLKRAKKAALAAKRTHFDAAQPVQDV